MKKNKLPKEFIIPKGYKGIVQEIKLSMDGKLAVITGLNGTGKTTLLQRIHDEYSEANNIFFKSQSQNQDRFNRRFNTRYSRYSRYSGYSGYSGYSDDSKLPSFDDVLEHLYDEFIRFYAREKPNNSIHKYEMYSALFDSSSYLYDLGYEFLEKVAEELRDFNEIDNIKKKFGIPTKDDIKKTTINELNEDDDNKKKYKYSQGKKFYEEHEKESTNIINILDNDSYKFLRDLKEKVEKKLKNQLRKKATVKDRSSFEDYLHQLIINFSFSIESIVEKIEKRIYEDVKGKGPKKDKLYQKLNEELLKFKNNGFFRYQIDAPSQYSSHYEITFKIREGDGAIMHFSSLSSGEKVVFELLCYYFIANKDDNLEMIILDEFDANLNPSLVDIYLDVIKKQFCEKGIKVVLTTHSPSTVAAVNADELYELTLNNNSHELVCAKNEDGKKAILKKLAPNFIYHSEFGNLEYILRDRKDVIVLLEGKNDKINFQSNQNYTFVSCEGADNIKNLLICFNTIDLFKNILTDKLVVALFDFDKKGREAIKLILTAKEDDAFASLIIDKKSLFKTISRFNNKCYIAMFTPYSEAAEWDYQSKCKSIEHKKLRKDTNLYSRQCKLLDEIVNDWKKDS